MVVFAAGCSDRGSNSPPVEQAPGPAVYGAPQGVPSAIIPRARPFAKDESWKSAPFSFVQTELSPATLFHSSSNYLGFFTGLKEFGLGAPAYVAFSTPVGPRVFKNGEPMDGSRMEESWVLVWFAGAKGWTNWDSPWVIYLQKKPKSMKLDADGLHLEFPQAAGDVVLLPLYGYYKPPQEGKEILAAHKLPAKKLKTWEWAKVLPKEPLMRIRYWASATREFPLYCEDSFSVDRAKDTVTIRQRIEWHSINDDWKTKHLKLAPVSPPLALAAMDKEFPVTFSKPLMNLDLCTPHGPYMAVENVDSFDATFHVLQYVNETEASDPSAATNAHPSVQAALDKLQTTAREKFRNPNKYDYDHGGLGNFCWAIQGDQWYAKALPYMDEKTRVTAVASLRKYFHDDVLLTNRFQLREFPKGSGREYYILEGPGSGSWNVLGDAGKFSANLLETLWAYAHFTGDWDLVKERWPLVKKHFTTPAETRWAGFGRDAIAELGDEAPPCLAMARLAYKVSDMDTYNYACYMFARELVHHHNKQRGSDYFRKNQPWHSMEWMDEEVYLTNLGGDVAGWQIDGPNYPASAGERQYKNRWVRFKDADVVRFYRDYLKADVRRELDTLQKRWDPKHKYHNDSHGLPSLVQLRSLLLNETPAELARVATPDQFTGPPSGVLGSCLAVIRTSHPTRYVRLIPEGAPSPFVAGLEREVAGPNVYLTQAIRFNGEDNKAQTNQAMWPAVTWWKSWKTPTGAPWTFGHVTPVREGTPASAQAVPLNWNSHAVTYSWP